MRTRDNWWAEWVWPCPREIISCWKEQNLCKLDPDIREECWDFSPLSLYFLTSHHELAVENSTFNWDKKCAWQNLSLLKEACLPIDLNGTFSFKIFLSTVGLFLKVISNGLTNVLLPPNSSHSSLFTLLIWSWGNKAPQENVEGDDEPSCKSGHFVANHCMQASPKRDTIPLFWKHLAMERWLWSWGPGSYLKLYHLAPAWPWKNHLTSLGFTFLIYNMRGLD